MSGQRKHRQPKNRQKAHRYDGPRSATFHCHSRCVRADEGFHALIYLNGTQVAAVRAGQPAQVTTNALPGVIVLGTVLTVDEAGPRHLVTVGITSAHSGLCHGLPVDVSIITSTKSDVLMVPNEAVIRHGDEFYVHVIEPGGETRRVQFTPGLIGHDTTEVLDGLREGQEVINSGDSAQTNPSA